MAYGRLGVSVPTANTDTVVYTAPVNCLYAEVDIIALNPDAAVATIKVALATTATPAANEYIENGQQLPVTGGVLERTGLKLSPGEKVVVRSTLGTTVFRVSGREIVS